jgi:cytochrome-b5 reductase
VLNHIPTIGGWQLSLLYANLSPENILLKDNLDDLAHAHPNFKVFYMVDIAATDWTGGLGRINKDVIMKGLPRPSHDTLILVSGPPGLVEHVCGDKEDGDSQGELAGLLKEIGYKMEQVYKF